MKNDIKSVFVNILRLLIALVFIFSGFVKCVDPWGFAYKLDDYFIHYGLSWMTSLSLTISMVLNIVEFVTGMLLLLNVKIKWAINVAGVLLSVFTPLTLLFAITNPVSDCGCFGEAVKLTNWQSFFKNLLMCLAFVPVYGNRSNFKSLFNVLEQSFIFLVLIILISMVEIFSYRHLPLIDFRPYAIGKCIADMQEAHEDNVHEDNAEEDLYFLTYRNVNTGEVKEFAVENAPWQDSLNWKFVSKKIVNAEKSVVRRSNSKLEEYGNLKIFDFEGRELSNEILANDNYTFLLIERDLSKVSESRQRRANKLAEFALANSYDFYGLTSSSKEDIEAYSEKNNLPYKLYVADDIELKTMIRTKIGVILIKDGIVFGKWGARDIPTELDMLGKNPVSYAVSVQRADLIVYKIIMLILAFASVLMLYMIRKYKAKEKKQF